MTNRSKQNAPPMLQHALVISPLEVDSVARREFQSPNVLERVGTKGPEWYVRYRVRVVDTKDGKPVLARREKWVFLGLQREMTKRQAERRRDEIMREVNGQIYALQSHVPFADFLKVYQEQHFRSLKLTTQRYYQARIDGWIKPFLAGKKLYQIDQLDVSRMLGAMETAGVARSTRKATRAITHSIFKAAKRWGYLKGTENPASEAEVGRSAGNARTIWTPTVEEAYAIIGQADAEVGLILELIVWTGMRISEATGLRCRNVDLKQGVAYVRERNVRKDFDTPKSATGLRVLPLGVLAERLAPLMGDGEQCVFRQQTGVPWDDQLLYARVRAAMDDAKLYHAGNAWHAFRRLHLNLMSKRLSLFDLLAQAGHSDVRTTQLYVGDDLGARHDAVREAQKVIPIRGKGAA